MKRFRLKFVLVSAAAVILAVFCCGCGASLHYDMPSGKTLVYDASSMIGVAENGKEVESKASKKEMEVRVRIIDCVGGECMLHISAVPPRGTQDPIFGKLYGVLEMHLDNKGGEKDIAGLGIPLEVRLLLPVLPDFRVRNHRTWTEPFKRELLQKNTALIFTHEYLGKTLVAGRPCFHITGAAPFKFSQKIHNQAQDFTANIDYQYSEDFYLSTDGYPLKMSVVESRRRVISDNYNNEILFDKKDYLNTEITFLRIE